jgi:hypothetical protein
VFVVPTTTAPAASSRSMVTLVVSATSSERGSRPIVCLTPAFDSWRSFIATGTPASGRSSPASIRSRTAAARSRASSRRTVTKALVTSLRSSMRSRNVSTTSTGSYSPDRTPSATSTAEA